MSGLQPEDTTIVDYWRQIARRGVEAVSFAVRSFAGETWMSAEVVGRPIGRVQEAAQAVVEIDKQIALDLGSAAWLLRVALAERLDTGAAAEMAAYRAMLVERPYAEFQDDPVDALARWALQDAAVTIYGRS